MNFLENRLYAPGHNESPFSRSSKAIITVRLLNGLNTAMEECNHLLESNEDLKSFIAEVNAFFIDQGFNTLHDIRSSALDAYLLDFETADQPIPKLHVSGSVFNRNAGFALIGDPALAKQYKELLEARYADNGCKVYKATYDESDGVRTKRVSIDKNPATQPFEHFYPFMDRPLEQYYDDYLASKESLLLLIGPPGGGKSTWLRGLCFKGQDQVLVCNDPAAIASGEIFTFFAGADFDLLILEDADQFLTPREDGNSMMTILLNETDGIIKQVQKKIVISTNLSSLNKVDKALYREGRCYDVLKFEPLTIAQARSIEDRQRIPAQDYGDAETVSLAKVLNNKATQVNNLVSKVGFN